MGLPRLWIFAKWPEPGHVKTRLCPPLTHEQAADLAMAFLQDRVFALKEAEGLDGGIAFAPADLEAKFRQAFPRPDLFPQGGGDLGERMARAVRAGFEEGRPAVLLLGGDVPLLPPSLPAEAARILVQNRADLVLTPALDGGYSMIGLNRYHPELFEGMEWSVSTVLEETLRRSETLGLNIHFTDPVADCDTFDDFLDLVQRWRESPIHFREMAPFTARFIETVSKTDLSGF